MRYFSRLPYQRSALALLSGLLLAGCSQQADQQQARQRIEDIAATAPLPKLTSAQQRRLQAQISPTLSDSGKLRVDLYTGHQFGWLSTEIYQRTGVEDDSERPEAEQHYLALSNPEGLQFKMGKYKAPASYQDEQGELFAATRSLLSLHQINSSDFYLYLPDYDSTRTTQEQLHISQQIGLLRADLTTTQRNLPGRFGGQQHAVRSGLTLAQGPWQIRWGSEWFSERSTHFEQFAGNDLTLSFQHADTRITANANWLDHHSLSAQSVSVAAQQGPWSLGILSAENQQQHRVDTLYAAFEVPAALDIRRLNMTLALQYANVSEELKESLDTITRYELTLDYAF